MIKYFKTFFVIFLLNQNIYAESLKSNASNSQGNQERLDIISNGAMGILNESKSSLITEDPLQTQNYNTINKDVDFSNFKEVSLKRVILETISLSNTLKAANEKLIQAKITYDESRTGYLPSVDFQLDTKIEKTYSSIDNTRGERETKTANDQRYKFTINQPIYSGGTTALKIKSVEAKYKEAKFKYEIVLNQTIQQAISAYFKLLFDIEKVKIAKKNMEKLTKILEISQVKYDSGAINVGDLAAIKAGVANSQSMLNKTKSKLADSIDYYIYLLGDEFQNTKPYEKNFSVDLGSFEDLKNDIISKNLNLINYRLNILGTKYKLKSFKYTLKPKVDLQMNMSHILNQDDYTDDIESYSAKLVLRYNIFNKGLDTNKITKVYSTVEELKYRYQEEIKKISWDTSKLYNSIKSLKESLQSTKDEIKSSLEMVNIYWEGFQLGEQDLQVLLQGQRQLNTAQINILKLTQDYLTNIFKVLNQTNELSSFFDIDPYSTNFVDYSNVKTVKNVIQMDRSIKDNLFELNTSKKTYLELINEYSFDDILSFRDKFLESNNSKYTILISEFNNTYDSYDFIKLNRLFDKSFSFDYIKNKDILNIISLKKNLQIKTNIAYGIYDNKKDAQNSLDDFDDYNDKQMKIVKVKKIKELYSNYINGIEASIEPYIIKVKKIKKFQTNLKFKNKFLQANKEKYTINIVSFTKIAQAEKLLNRYNINDEAFVFRYGLNGEWVKVMYGIFDTYSEALATLTNHKSMLDQYHPIIEKIYQKQKLYDRYKKFNQIKKVQTKLEKPSAKEIKLESIKFNDNIDNNITKDTNTTKKETIKDEKNKIVYNEEFAQKLFKSDGYTIHMGYVNPNRVIGFANDYLKDNHFAKVKVGNLYKILYGIYKTKKEAKDAILKLHPKRVKKAKIMRLNFNKQDKKDIIKPNSDDNNKLDINRDLNISKNQDINLSTIKNEINLNNINKDLIKKTYKNNFKESFYKNENSFTIELSKVKKEKIKYFINRYILDKNYIVIKKGGIYTIYYGIYKSKDDAKLDSNNVHPTLVNSVKIYKIKSVL